MSIIRFNVNYVFHLHLQDILDDLHKQLFKQDRVQSHGHRLPCELKPLGFNGFENVEVQMILIFLTLPIQTNFEIT